MQFMKLQIEFGGDINEVNFFVFKLLPYSIEVNVLKIFFILKK